MSMLQSAQMGMMAAGMIKSGWQFYMQSCFAAGTPLLTPDGSKLIEKFVARGFVLSRSEFDLEGPLAAKVVEEVFVRLGHILILGAGGQEIKTTPEHPFWVVDKGWTPAGQLVIGDVLVGHDGQRKAVERLVDTGEYTTVYNLRWGPGDRQQRRRACTAERGDGPQELALRRQRQRRPHGRGPLLVHLDVSAAQDRFIRVSARRLHSPTDAPGRAPR
jgi:Pretoxin HINT domain